MPVLHEIARPIPGVEKPYLVSDHGRITSYIRKRPRVLKPQPLPSGHLRVYVGGSTRLLHHLVLAAFVGPMPAGMEVRHLNGDPTDNRLENLAYGTRSENVRDAIAHGTHGMTRKTHCPQGHEYSRKTERQRLCDTCKRAARQRYVDKKKGQGQ